MPKKIYVTNIKGPLSFPLIQYPVAFFDFLWVSIIYSICSFSLAALIDGHLLPPFDYSYTEKESTLVLAIQVILQLAFQGFIAIMLLAILQKVPSPVKGIAGYNSHSSLGILLRNPALISVLLFSLSKSLQGRLAILYSRFNRNGEIGLFIYKNK
uniref:Uncharacterized protein n=1 Tax=viral metagenome TaxID=1070528 RepID=A0A6C0LG96_9ZZZZ